MDASLVDVLPSEGERIGKGQVLAKIYSDQDTLQRERDKAEIDRQLEQLSYFGGTYGLDISGRNWTKEYPILLLPYAGWPRRNG